MEALGSGEVDDGLSGGQLRRWLELLRRPDQMASPELAELLRRHERLPATASAVATGQAGAQLLREAIERLHPSAAATRDDELPYLVLRTCFVEGAKLFQAAARLGMSERQLTRERARAIELLRAVLEVPWGMGGRRYRPERVPVIDEFLSRPAEEAALREAVRGERLVHVHGPAGVGKSALVAEVAAELEATLPVLWVRFRPGVNDSLGALLFELADHLRETGWDRLAVYLEGALPAVDVALATRLALAGFGGALRVLVVDDYHVVDQDPGIRGLVEEMALRLPELRIVTVGRHRDQASATGVAFEAPPLTRKQTQELLARLGAVAGAEMADMLHAWTAGIPHLIKLAASWMHTATPEEVARGAASLDDLAEVQAFLLDNITELIDTDDRLILEAASIFRDRFTDDALAYVAGRTRGQVQDASRRLVRLYIATRSREGDCSFFHTSIRDYVYARLGLERRRELHRRAAEWSEAQGRPDAARMHRLLAAERTATGPMSAPGSHPRPGRDQPM